MSEELTQYLIKTGDEFYDYLPNPGEVDDEYDPIIALEAFFDSEMDMLKHVLWDHLRTVAQDWEDQSA